MVFDTEIHSFVPLHYYAVCYNNLTDFLVFTPACCICDGIFIVIVCMVKRINSHLDGNTVINDLLAAHFNFRHSMQ